MTVARNAPCPCGSGRKYKHCCQAADRARAAGAAGPGGTPGRVGSRLAPAARAEASRQGIWAADAVPLMVRFDEDDTDRPVLLVVTAGDVVVHSDMRERVGGEAGDVAKALARAVTAAGSAVGMHPARLLVRHDDVAEALAPLLEGRDIAVGTGAPEGLVTLARHAMDHFANMDHWPPICRVDTWAAWDLPRGLVGDVFTAAARFYRLAPWRDATNLQAPRAVLPSGREWTCCLLGNAGREFGLALYSDAADLDAQARGEPEDGFTMVEGRLVSLTFGTAREVGPAAVTEARRNRWEVAGPAAYPFVMTVNTPGGGVSRADMEDMLALLEAVPAFVQAHSRELAEEDRTLEPTPAIDWVEPGTGIRFRYAGEAARFETGLHEPGPMSEDLRQEVREVVRQVTEELGDDVDGATLVAAVNARLMETMDTLNERPQSELGGLSPRQVRRLLESDWNDPTGAVRLARDLTPDQLAGAHILANARALLDLAIERGGLEATQKGNLKLEVVAALMERWHARDQDYLRYFSGMKRITEMDFAPLHRLRLACALAGLIHKRRQRFQPTRKARSLADPERAGELYATLFTAWFRKLNLAYGHYFEWPELQHQAAFTLYQLPRRAVDWRTARELLPHVVLPFALDRVPEVPALRGDAAPGILAVQFLGPLADFGLLDYELAAPGARVAEGRFRVTPLAAAFLRIEP